MLLKINGDVMGEGKNIYWSKFVKDLAPYEPGEQPGDENVVKLNTNESPFGPSPNAVSYTHLTLPTKRIV